MLGRLFNARLKAAETALTGDRIDEAFRLATSPDLAGERRAQRVLAQAGEKLFGRAESHYKAGRSAEALIDLGKAERAGINAARISDLRTIVRAAAEDAQRDQQSRRSRLEAAQQRLAHGSLRAAEQILARAGPDRHRDAQDQRLIRNRIQRHHAEPVGSAVQDRVVLVVEVHELGEGRLRVVVVPVAGSLLDVG